MDNSIDPDRYIISRIDCNNYESFKNGWKSHSALAGYIFPFTIKENKVEISNRHILYPDLLITSLINKGILIDLKKREEIIDEILENG